MVPGGSFAEQWKDLHTVTPVLSQTTAPFPAVRRGTNAGGVSAVITFILYGRSNAGHSLH
jgi:hypothetical protein